MGMKRHKNCHYWIAICCHHHHGVFIWVTRSFDLWGSYTLFGSVDCVWLLFWLIFTVVSLRLLMSSSKISFLYTFVLFVVWRPGQISMICSCVSIGSLHILHFSCWYLFLKFALMSSMLVLALKIMSHSRKPSAITESSLLIVICYRQSSHLSVCQSSRNTTNKTIKSNILSWLTELGTVNQLMTLG